MAEVLKVDVAVIGSGPAGLMAASVLSKAGRRVSVFEAKPSFGRKFLMAGKSGLNITKTENKDDFLNCYKFDNLAVGKAIANFLPDDVANWCKAHGVETFVGSSGRVFPKVMKASTLLRAWLRELSSDGVRFFTRHRWVGFEGQQMTFETPDGTLLVEAKVTIFALGGKSWARLGSDGEWQSIFEAMGVDVQPFQPSNCGFNCAWDDHFIEKFGGVPVKNVMTSHVGVSMRGDFVITRHGVEGGIIYPLAASLRDALEEDRTAILMLDLKPDMSVSKIEKALSRPRGRNSFSNHLRKTLKLTGAKAGLLRMVAPDTDWQDVAALANLIKALPLEVISPRPIDEAISTAGGVAASALDPSFMLTARPGVFIAGEMLDWDAPTGGYLITGCLATGKAAGEGALRWLSASENLKCAATD